MADSPLPPDRRITLRKYRNRRYYDSTRSLHVTLEDILTLVREGCTIEVTDSQSGEDITGRVLAQIILEHDPLKLGVFPVELLHQIIRASEPLIREFVDKYFSQALAAYLESQRQFDRFLRQTLGLETPAAVPSDWMRMMMWPLGGSPAARGAPPASAASTPPKEDSPKGDSAEIAELRRLVDELRRQVESLHERNESG